MDLETQQELNKHTAAIVNAITALGRTSVFEINFAQQPSTQANIAVENWTKEMHKHIKEVLGDDHYVVSKFKEKWKI